nr:hypothetical protein Iba_chr10bCG11450 [Ipomoea batatas]
MTRASSESGDREKRERIWGSFTAENGIFPAAERGRKVAALVVLVKCNFIMLPCYDVVLWEEMTDWDSSRFNLEHLEGQVVRVPGRSILVANRYSFNLCTILGSNQRNLVHLCALCLVAVENCVGIALLVAHHSFAIFSHRETGENLGEFHGGKWDFSGGRAREESGCVGGFGEVQFHVVALLQVILLEEKGHVGVVVELILRGGVEVVEGILAGGDADEDWLTPVVAADDYAALPNAHCPPNIEFLLGPFDMGTLRKLMLKEK